MRDITVLITACSTNFMTGLIKSLKSVKERTIKVIGVDIVDDPVIHLFVDKFYRVSKVDSGNYIDELIEISKKELVNIILPNMSSELQLIAESKHLFEKIGVIVSVSNSASLKIVNDKLELYNFMKEEGMETPNYFELTKLGYIRKIAKKLNYPDKSIVLKVSESSGSRGVRIIDNNFSKYQLFITSKPSSLRINLSDMIKTLKTTSTMARIMMMEYLPGIEYSVDLLADKGSVLYIVGRKNTISLHSIAQESMIYNEEIAFSICRKIVERLKMDGNIGFDFMYNSKGVPIITDINPRITATISLSTAAGINLVYLRIKQLLGEKIPQDLKCKTVILRRKVLDVFVDEEGNEVFI